MALPAGGGNSSIPRLDGPPEPGVPPVGEVPRMYMPEDARPEVLQWAPLVLPGLPPGSPPHSRPAEPSVLVALGSSGPGGVCGGVRPRNLNQKRTQTRPKAVGTICPSDVAGREI